MEGKGEGKEEEISRISSFLFFVVESATHTKYEREDE